MKAIVELQKAVTAKDFANVPAKVRGAFRREDQGGPLRDRPASIEAAVTASDDAGAAAAIDAIAGTEY